MQQVRTRTNQRRRASQDVRKEAIFIDYKDLLWSFQQHWRVITPVWAFLPAAFLASRLLGSVMDYSIVFWAFSLVFIGMFFLLSYRTYELVAEGRIPLSHWLVLVWIPWMPLAILSNAVTSFLGRLISG
jgi:hypothetical protein